MDRHLHVIRVMLLPQHKPNPGRAGAGAVVCTSTLTYLINEPVGIATALTAELCAIRMAMKFLLLDGIEELQVPASICLFVDSIVAIYFCTLVWLPTSNYAICRK